MRRAAQQFLENFDEIFAVLDDNDAEKLQALGFGPSKPRMATPKIEKLVAERQAARKRRDFATSDQIRKQLADRGIILEDSQETAPFAGNANEASSKITNCSHQFLAGRHVRPNLYGVD